MCTNCIISNYDTCSFRGWDENCEQCKKGKRPKCTFKVPISQRSTARNILAVASRGSQLGKFLLLLALRSLTFSTDLARAMREFSESYSRYASLTALAIQARQGVFDASLLMAAYLRNIYGYSEDCPPGMDAHIHQKAADFLASLSEPDFVTRLSETGLLSKEFAAAEVQEILNQLLPEPRGGGPSTAEASTSASQTTDPATSLLSPQVPPAKRRRRTAAASAYAEMEGVIATTPQTFPPATAPLPPSPSTDAGPSLPSAGRISRSASRGSGRLSASGSQTDLKRKRKGGK
jgi:hypothetical protein